VLAVLAVLGGLACGGGAASGTSGEAAGAVDADPAIDRWVARDGPPSDTGGEGDLPPAARPDRFAPRRVGPAARSPAPPRSGRRVDARFEGADLVNALRFLAERAGVSLVVGDGVSGRVDLVLRDVDPLEMIFVLARTHGARAALGPGGVVLVAGE